MRHPIFLALIAFTAVVVNAQSKPTSAEDYNGTFQYAVSETNAAFPFVFTVVTERYSDGKLVSTETDVNERQAQGVARKTKTLVRDGKTLHSYSIMVGFGNNTYCSMDGATWTGPQKYVCSGPDGSGLFAISRPRTPESVEYSVTESSLDGKPVKIYRKYAIFPAATPNGTKAFEDMIATIDARGFFISVQST